MVEPHIFLYLMYKGVLQHKSWIRCDSRYDCHNIRHTGHYNCMWESPTDPVFSVMPGATTTIASTYKYNCQFIQIQLLGEHTYNALLRSVSRDIVWCDKAKLG